MSESPASHDASGDSPSLSGLTSKQARILSFLENNVQNQLYFKSRLIGEELGLTPKEVGANMTQLQKTETDLTIEQWGFSNSTTWKITK